MVGHKASSDEVKPPPPPPPPPLGSTRVAKSGEDLKHEIFFCCGTIMLAEDDLVPRGSMDQENLTELVKGHKFILGKR